MRLRLLLAALVLIVLPAATRADTLFTFRGANFVPSESSGVYGSGLNDISGSFVTTTKIFPGMIYGPLDVTSFTMTDGFVTLDPGNAVLYSNAFSISTDSKNRISNFGFEEVSTACYTMPDAPGDCFADDVMSIGSLANYPGYPLVVTESSSSAFGEGENYPLPDVPTATATITETFIQPTPEPSTIVLLATGLLGVAGVVRKRFAE